MAPFPFAFISVFYSSTLLDVTPEWLPNRQQALALPAGNF